MKQFIVTEIECGETTCAVEKGKFCPYFRYTLNGKMNCAFFGVSLFEREDGWTARAPICLEQTKLAENKLKKSKK